MPSTISPQKVGLDESPGIFQLSLATPVSLTQLCNRQEGRGRGVIIRFSNLPTNFDRNFEFPFSVLHYILHLLTLIRLIIIGNSRLGIVLSNIVYHSIVQC